MLSDRETVKYLLKNAVPVLRINRILIDEPKWFRNVPENDGRYGPWVQADFTVLNMDVWKEKQPCLYMCVSNTDSILKYVGISRNRMKDRWRVSPAISMKTGTQLPKKQLFHSQCWRNIEREALDNPDVSYTIYCLMGEEISRLIRDIACPLSGLSFLEGDAEGVAAAVERFICNRQSDDLATWNIAMTSRVRRI